jgi:hypothetical protein
MYGRFEAALVPSRCGHDVDDPAKNLWDTFGSSSPCSSVTSEKHR